MAPPRGAGHGEPGSPLTACAWHRCRAVSIKITNEAPAGVRAGLKNSYAWITQDMLDAQSQKEWKSMLYALCFMHTIVQERRKFGPLGFNIPYEFNQSDLSACVQYMQNHLSLSDTKKRPIDWEAVNYMICDVQYGGRITDDWDRRLFNTYGQVSSITASTRARPRALASRAPFVPRPVAPTSSRPARSRRSVSDPSRRRSPLVARCGSRPSFSTRPSASTRATRSLLAWR